MSKFDCNLGMDVTIPETTPYPTPDPNGNCDPNGQRWKYYNGQCYFFRYVVGSFASCLYCD